MGRHLTADGWASRVAVGDIVRSPRGLLRVVRSVSRYTGRLRWNNVYARKVHVTFTIAHCSWTHRPYTVYNIGELFGLGYRPTGKTFALDTEFDSLMLADIQRSTGRSADCVFDCCDVVGIP